MLVDDVLLVSEDEIHAAVLGARASLRWWEAVVGSLRAEHYFLCFCSLRRLDALRTHLTDLRPTPRASPSSAPLLQACASPAPSCGYTCGCKSARERCAL